MMKCNRSRSARYIKISREDQTVPCRLVSPELDLQVLVHPGPSWSILVQAALLVLAEKLGCPDLELQRTSVALVGLGADEAT